MSRWRQAFYKLVPSWLSSGDGEKVLYTLGRLTDGFIERARLSLTARFPTYSGPTGLALLGDERGIIKGRNEDNAGYARRLRGWRGPRGHQVRGSAFAMLYQIWNYFDGMKCQEIDTSGNVYTTARDGTETATHGGTWNWDGDQSWFRFWLRLMPDADQGIHSWGPLTGAWGGKVGGTGRGYTVGQTGVTPGDCATVRNLFRGEHPWKMAGTKPEWLVLAFDDDPHEPDGTWHNWTYNGEPARDPALRYWKL